MLYRSGKSIFGHGIQAIDLDNQEEDQNLFALDIDLDDEEAVFQEQRLNGGDRSVA